MFESLVSVLSDSYLIVIPIIIIYLFYRRDKRAYTLVLSLVLAIIIVTAIKTAVVEPRPCSDLGAVLCQDPLQSFPSRHVAIVAVPLVFFISDMLIFMPYLAYALMIGLTRILLNEHYPHDVLAGFIIGLAVAYVCIRFSPKLFGKGASKKKADIKIKNNHSVE